MIGLRRTGLAAAALVALVALGLTGCAEVERLVPPPPGATQPSPAATFKPVNPGDLPVVTLADLPPEAAETVARIDAGGPFPYRQDDAVFENREGLLPKRPAGHYREYTVPTPGSPDRGARRIVTGQDGEMYWTSDHYDSFAWIDR